MKKTFRRSDGTEETVEGTAEEIAEYERRLRGEITEQKKPPVLKGAELDGEPVTDQEVEMIRSFRKMWRDPNTFRVPDHYFQPIPYVPPVIVPTPAWCQYCGTYGCNQTHIICKTTTVAGTTLNGDGLAQMIKEHPDWDWTGLAAGGGARIPLS